ncbi:hypothetical protein [Alicyclobacillus sendaiensis]|uniref:hypothetical protein n=1 Tax=Alicyclobacillus sendaiensis TaxID=192387 RepID=UPI0026F43F6F|nr:hypothetical protein [Alicyclobacillus sendaiensis]
MAQTQEQMLVYPMEMLQELSYRITFTDKKTGKQNRDLVEPYARRVFTPEKGWNAFYNDYYCTALRRIRVLGRKVRAMVPYRQQGAKFAHATLPFADLETLVKQKQYLETMIAAFLDEAKYIDDLIAYQVQHGKPAGVLVDGKIADLLDGQQPVSLTM